MSVSIPLLLQVDPSNFPPGPAGPPGAGIVAEQKWASFAPGLNTISPDLVASGVFLEMTSTSETDEFEIDVGGVVGSSYAVGTSVPLCLCRDGAPLLAQGQNYHCATFVPNNSAIAAFSICAADAPGSVGTFRYEVWFKSFAAAAYLGRRGIDATTFSIPTIMRARRLLKP